MSTALQKRKITRAEVNGTLRLKSSDCQLIRDFIQAQGGAVCIPDKFNSRALHDFECANQDQANERERFWIKVLKCKVPNGYMSALKISRHVPDWCRYKYV